MLHARTHTLCVYIYILYNTISNNLAIFSFGAYMKYYTQKKKWILFAEQSARLRVLCIFACMYVLYKFFWFLMFVTCL